MSKLHLVVVDGLTLDLVAVLVPPFCSLMGTNWLLAVVEPAAAAAEDEVG